MVVPSMILYLTFLHGSQLALAFNTTGPLNLAEDDICRIENGEGWKCKRVQECGTGYKEELELCNGVKSHLVCCPPTRTQRDIYRKANMYCERYMSLCCNNIATRQLNPRHWPDVQEDTNSLADGIIASGQLYPHMALIGYGEEKQWLCSGSLISEKYILSAAQCSYHTSLGEASWARLGNGEDRTHQVFSIVKRVVHPRWREGLLYDDIALYLLERPAPISLSLQPLCLHTLSTVPYRHAIFTDWISTGMEKESSPSLVPAAYEVLSMEDCSDLIIRIKGLPYGFDSSTMICGAKMEDINACHGYLGGAMVIKQSNRCLWSQVGILSLRNSCGHDSSPAVFTRVSAYLTWIESIVWT